MNIRHANKSDRQRIIEIYNQAVETGFSTADTGSATVESRLAWFDGHNEDSYPIYVEEDDGEIRAWCTLSPYRKGRKALRYTAEISYYVDNNFQRLGIATRLIKHALQDCSRLKLKTLFAIILESNLASLGLLEKLGFESWGYLPGVADFNGTECGHTYLGKRVG